MKAVEGQEMTTENRARFWRHLVHDDRGFTLMELVVSVFIIAVMTAVVTPHLLSAGKRAQTAACEENQRTIRAALSEYDLLYHGYPTGNSMQQLQLLQSSNILTTVPVDPSGGNYVINDSDVNNVQVSCDVDGTLGAP